MSEHNRETTPRSSATPGGDTGRPSEGVLVIQGIFDPAGEKLLELGPIRRYSRSWEESPFESEGYFAVEVAETTGDVTIVEFDALVADDSESGVIEHGFFEVFVPMKGEIASIRITDASGEKTFAQVDGSEILL